MDIINIKGLILTPLKQINNPKGKILHAIKKDDDGFISFGEVYFSTVNQNQIKGWNKHMKMTLNLVVPVGKVLFIIHDSNNSKNSNFFEIYLSQDNYQRLTIPPNLWIAFKGIDKEPNLIMNLSNLEHDPDELVKKDLNEIDYDWSIR